MSELIFKRRKHGASGREDSTVIRVENRAYNKALLVADETGLAVSKVASRMLEFAYDHVKYEPADELEEGG